MHVVASIALALGALDSAQFATQNRKRARQSLGVAAVWAVAFIASIFSSREFRVATLVLAVLLTVGGIALLLIHIRHGIASPRVWLAPALGVVALTAAALTL